MHVLSCFVQLKGVLFIFCVFWILHGVVYFARLSGRSYLSTGERSAGQRTELSYSFSYVPNQGAALSCTVSTQPWLPIIVLHTYDLLTAFVTPEAFCAASVGVSRPVLPRADQYLLHPARETAPLKKHRILTAPPPSPPHFLPIWKEIQCMW